MQCLIFFGMSSMKEGTAAQLSGRGELHGGARVTTLVTLRKCTLGNKREIKRLKFVLASTKGFKGGLAWIKPSRKDMAVTFSYWRGREQGTDRGKNVFTVVQPLVMAFLPCSGRAAHSTNVLCRPHTPGTDQHRNKWHTCAQRLRLREHPLRRQGTNAEQTNQEATNTTTHSQNHYSGRNVTVNRPRAHRPAPSWPGMHGPVRERRPTS